MRRLFSGSVGVFLVLALIAGQALAQTPFKDLEGKVGSVDEESGKVKVLVSMFGRETPVELDFLQVRRV